MPIMEGRSCGLSCKLRASAMLGFGIAAAYRGFLVVFHEITSGQVSETPTMLTVHTTVVVWPPFYVLGFRVDESIRVHFRF